MMSSMAMRNQHAAVPVSNWDKRIRNHRRRRAAKVRGHILQLFFAIGFLCVALLCVNRVISKAENVRKEDISVKYYKNICVESGDTLTSIARTYADDEHYETLEKYMEEVVYMNHLKSADDICAGYYLIIPYFREQ